jgi:hypothetical protein
LGTKDIIHVARGIHLILMSLKNLTLLRSHEQFSTVTNYSRSIAGTNDIAKFKVVLGGGG